ncbi:chemotaxis response regulator protein-glutamate methylesterase [Polynucleobacter sp. AP-Latsch-80-C2]|uniref:protein-glutamate methylesterase/protein-glutamine glutaminase n=1 Tax=Polynucleobacter sp. AP-Latsch-80-C2 TaxID=2576931 RepID=UPI001C0CD5ED|nr:chemotaxis response regulator protein-glutamate methylesterase [Polynucleobacter sp. AP-Latsch-80-C2]
MDKVRVLIVDDSAVMRKIIASALQKEPSIEIAGFAANGLQAIEAIQTCNPDVMTLDIEMPEMDGLTALREIRKENKYLPIIMFSSLTHKGAQAAVMALTAGASDYVGKPANATGGIDDAFKVLETELIPKIIGLAKRVKSRREREGLSASPQKTAPSIVAKPPVIPKPIAPVKPIASLASKISKATSGVLARPAEAVCIGVSTGGPEALMQVFGAFNAPLSVPIFIVQHMPADFTALLAARLSTTGVMTVKEAQEGEIAEPGVAYIAPGGFHMTVSRPGTKTIIHLNTEPPENSCRPAVDVLFRTAAEVYGNHLLAVMLTGMGYDGLKGSQVIKEKGGQVIAQDEATSVIWGMPGAVVQAGLADGVLPIDKITDEIIFRTRKVPASR